MSTSKYLLETVSTFIILIGLLNTIGHTAERRAGVTKYEQLGLKRDTITSLKYFSIVLKLSSVCQRRGKLKLNISLYYLHTWPPQFMSLGTAFGFYARHVGQGENTTRQSIPW